LILDLELPDIHGLEVRQQLSGINGPPIVFLTGRGNVSSSVRAMKSGAVEFLLKPVRKQELLKAISEALKT
jgi:FixJ family two-component response regulator